MNGPVPVCNMTQFPQKYATTVNAMAAGTDIAITVITCTLLARERAGFNKRFAVSIIP
jgi:hypothetical protein